MPKRCQGNINNLKQYRHLAPPPAIKPAGNEPAVDLKRSWLGRLLDRLFC